MNTPILRRGHPASFALATGLLVYKRKRIAPAAIALKLVALETSDERVPQLVRRQPVRQRNLAKPLVRTRFTAGASTRRSMLLDPCRCPVAVGNTSPFGSALRAAALSDSSPSRLR